MPLLSTLVDVGSLVAMGTGVAFGIQQWLQYKRGLDGERQRRHLEAAVTAVQSLQTIEVYEAGRRLGRVQGTVSLDDLEKDPELAKAVSTVYMAMEPLGYLVYLRAVPLEVATEFVGGSVTALWRRIRPVAEALRERNKMPNSYEWFQWLAERIEANPIEWKKHGAYKALGNWLPLPMHPARPPSLPAPVQAQAPN